MASASKTVLLDAKLDKAKGELQFYVQEKKEAFAALERAKKAKDDELVKGARNQIATAEKAIARAEEDIKKFRKEMGSMRAGATTAGTSVRTFST